MTRSLSESDLAYDRISATWAGVVDRYDTGRRMEVLLNEFLGGDRVRGRACLDAGAGLGFFSEGLLALGASRVTAVEIAPRLVVDLAARVPQLRCVVGDVLGLDAVLGSESFDVVVSSEVIEHTPDPGTATRQICSRVAPGGWLAISCPNRRWKWTLAPAGLLGLRRHYQGHENWASPGALQAWVRSAGLEIIRAEGIHLIPWQPCPKRWLRAADRAARSWSYGIGVNLALLARRPA